MTLIEILIALFVFLVGALGIFAIIPVSMDQASRAIRNRRGVVLARHAAASLTYDLGRGRPMFSGRVETSSAFTTQVAGAPGWTANQWVNAYASLPTSPAQTRRITVNAADAVTVAPVWTSAPDAGARLNILRHYEGWVGSATATTLEDADSPAWDTVDGGQWADWAVVLLSGTGAGQARLVVSNTANTLTIADAWTDIPDTTTRFRVCPVALNSQVAGSPRSGTIEDVIDETTLDTDPEIGIDAADLNAGDFFLLVTSGRARGRICEVTGKNATEITATDVDFLDDGVRPGDTFVVLGNSSGIYSFPGTAFGVVDADPPQTARDPSDPDSDYSYAAIFSDPGPLATGDFPPVRVDILVFQFYNNALPPGENQRAALFQTAYVKQP